MVHDVSAVLSSRINSSTIALRWHFRPRLLGHWPGMYRLSLTLVPSNRIQFAWLQQGYQLEFLGNSTFVTGLWSSSILFFLVNVAILGTIINDIRIKKIDTILARTKKAKPL